MESRTYPEIRREIIGRIAANPMSPDEIKSVLKNDPAQVVDDITSYLVQTGVAVWDSSGYKLTIPYKGASE